MPEEHKKHLILYIFTTRRIQMCPLHFRESRQVRTKTKLCTVGNFDSLVERGSVERLLFNIVSAYLESHTVKISREE